MSNREMCIKLVDSVPEYKLGVLLAYLQGLTAEGDVDADDAFCEAMFKQYEADPDKGEAVSIEEAAKLLGVAI